MQKCSKQHSKPSSRYYITGKIRFAALCPAVCHQPRGSHRCKNEFPTGEVGDILQEHVVCCMQEHGIMASRSCTTLSPAMWIALIGLKSTNKHQPMEEKCYGRSSECRRVIYKTQKDTQALETPNKWDECNNVMSDNSKTLFKLVWWILPNF